MEFTPYVSDEEQKEIEDYDESDFETWNWSQSITKKPRIFRGF